MGADVLEEDEELFDEAVRVVRACGYVSIAYVQRKCRIGFSRAARLIDMMEARGIVTPFIDGRPREVVKP